MTTFRDKLEQRIAATGSNLCVGLDIRAKSADDATRDGEDAKEIEIVGDEREHPSALVQPGADDYRARFT
jgi:hypothetical protein